MLPSQNRFEFRMLMGGLASTLLLSANGAIAQDLSTPRSADSPQPAAIAPAAPVTLDEILANSALTPITPASPASMDLGSDPMAQVTSVTEFSDVSPGDWAYEALAYLANTEAEGGLDCLEGYPDGTFRGNRSLTRFEFAAGLASCLDAIATRLDTLDPDALARIEALQREFADELAQLRGRVDALEAAVAELEENQFSTTTVLAGEAIFNVSDLWSDQVGEFNNTVFQSRVRLNFQTSFRGPDTLNTRLAMGNVEPFNVPGSLANLLVPNVVPVGTAEGVLIHQIGGRTDYQVDVDWLNYSFPLGDRLSVYLGATGSKHSDYVFSTVSPYFQDYDGGNGAISPFSQESPIFRIGGGSGLGLNYAFDNDRTLVLSVGYLGEDAGNPNQGAGLFNGDYAALGQLTFTPSNSFQIAFTYVNGYHTEEAVAGAFPVNGGTADSISNTNPIFDQGFGNNTFFTGTVPANAVYGALGVPAVTNSYGLELSWRISPGITLNGFGGYTNLILLETGGGDIWYYGLGLAFPDLFADGNLGGIMVGVEPYLASLDGLYTLDGLGVQNDISIHAEAFYRVQLNDHVSLTPGIILITAPEQNSGNDAQIVGTLRTTFSF